MQQLFKILFMHAFLVIITISTYKENNLISDKFEDVPCQNFHTVADKHRPRVFHKVLTPSFLKKFQEILVIGDVHGNFDELHLLLQKANAAVDTVLKIFTGDVTRGGPKNMEILHFIQNSRSALTVRGNNDEVTINTFHNKTNSMDDIKSLDFWIKYLTKKDIAFLKQLPYTISIPSLNTIIMHAGMIPGIPLSQSTPYDLMNIRSLVPAAHCPSGYAPTRDITEDGVPWAELWTGPQKIVFGHDHKRMLQIYPMATGIDTNCDRGSYLTGLFISGPRAGLFVHQPALAKHFKIKPRLVKIRNVDLVKGHGYYEKVSKHSILV